MPDTAQARAEKAYPKYRECDHDNCNFMRPGIADKREGYVLGWTESQREQSRRETFYRDLLKKYIHHVGNEEGVTYVPSSIRCCMPGDCEFTEEDIKRLNECDDEVKAIFWR